LSYPLPAGKINETRKSRKIMVTDMGEIPETIEFDIRGQICPSTLLIALREINRNQEQLRKGELVIRFKTDNRDSVNTIPESAIHMGYRAEIEKLDNYYTVTVYRPSQGMTS
jgi:TusA-related sulfurtransferase